MAYLKAAVAMTLGVYTSRSFIDCNLFQMGLFLVARFLLTSAPRNPSVIAELLVLPDDACALCIRLHQCIACALDDDL